MGISKKGNNVFEPTPENMNEAVKFLKKQYPVTPSKQSKPEIFKNIRYALGMSQEDFADFLATRARTISRWENGDSKPSLNYEQFTNLSYELAKIGIDVNYLSIPLDIESTDLKTISSFKIAYS